MDRLKGKAALITGGGSGMGRASCVLFAREGARVTVVDRAVDAGQETVGQIRDEGGEASFVEADVAAAADVERMVAATVGAYGRIDVLFNNAGIEGVDEDPGPAAGRADRAVPDDLGAAERRASRERLPR